MPDSTLSACSMQKKSKKSDARLLRATHQALGQSSPTTAFRPLTNVTAFLIDTYYSQRQGGCTALCSCSCDLIDCHCEPFLWTAQAELCTAPCSISREHQPCRTAGRHPLPLSADTPQTHDYSSRLLAESQMPVTAGAHSCSYERIGMVSVMV